MFKQIILIISLLVLLVNAQVVEPPMTLAQLTAQFTGKIIGQKDVGYHDARFGYNCRYNRIPNIILQPNSTASVVLALKYAQTNKLQVSVKSGGHSASFLGMLDDRVVIDVSQLKSISFDNATMTISAGTGNKQVEIYAYCSQFGVGTPGGSCPSVGSGLSLGGGANDLSTVYGYAVDNVLELEIVLADRSVVIANENQNQDLYWALRGGGHGSFGIVTRITYRAYNLRPKYYSAWITYDWDDFEVVAKRVNDYSKLMPDIINLYFTVWRSGPAAIPSVALSCFSNGDPSEAEYHCGATFRNISGVIPTSYSVTIQDYYTTVRTGTDPKARKSQTKGSFLVDLSKNAIKKIKSQLEDSPITPFTYNTARLNLYWQGGQMLKKPRNFNAFVHRTYPWNAVWLISYASGDYESNYLNWMQKTYQKMNAFSANEVYQNYQDDTLEDWEEKYYGENYATLRTIKSRYDPSNYFNYLQSIRPEDN